MILARTPFRFLGQGEEKGKNSKARARSNFAQVALRETKDGRQSLCGQREQRLMWEIRCPAQANCIRAKLSYMEPNSFLYLKGETKVGVNASPCLSSLHEGYLAYVPSQAGALFPVPEAAGEPQRQTSMSPSCKIRLGTPAAGKKVFWHIICITAK